jgi:outer membrane protein OmpA-like peptidoglycan-associated protein
MKKMFFLLIAANSALSAIAQTQDTTHKKQPYTADSLLSRWTVDLNVLGGVLDQDLTVVNTSNNYPNAVSTNIGSLKFTGGRSVGFNAQLGYFFDNKAHFGVGTGLMYFHQWGIATLDNYRVDFKSFDATGAVYRQIITANQPVRETLKVSNFNIPLVFKYKNRFSKSLGFTADAGILFNFSVENSYTTDASFDYEAVYQHVPNGDGTYHTVYDASPNYTKSDLVITKSHYLKTNPDGNVQDYFKLQRTLGYNVGLNEKPSNNKGSVFYSEGTVGFIIQPSLNYFINDKVALNLGAYYIYQSFKNDAGAGTRLTDRVGDYNSALSNVSSTVNHNYGLNLGVRLLFGKLRDRDKDGVPDRSDKCPLVPGVAQFNGCPDQDNDGVPDSKDRCPNVYGVMLFDGCPDSDGDGIADSDDDCPTAAGPRKLHGCPDSDNDGVSDADDRCPNAAGPAYNGGCPTDTPKRQTQRTDKPLHDITEPILFDLGKATIQEVSLGILTEAVIELRNNESAFVIIDGHTDNIGSDEINDVLSFRRANAVRRYMTEMGADPARMIAVGHGSRQPIAPNNTADGRAKNRRVIMSLRHRGK